MAPIDGAIGMKININHPQTTDVNISKAQPSKASGLGGVRSPRSKCAPILYKYRFQATLPCLPNTGLTCTSMIQSKVEHSSKATKK